MSDLANEDLNNRLAYLRSSLLTTPLGYKAMYSRDLLKGIPVVGTDLKLNKS